jgi:hypothetical protein
MLRLKLSVPSLKSWADGSQLTVAIRKAGTAGAELLIAERIAQIPALGPHRSPLAKRLGPKRQDFAVYTIGS